MTSKEALEKENHELKLKKTNLQRANTHLRRQIKKLNKKLEAQKEDYIKLRRSHLYILEERCIKCVFNKLCDFKEEELKKILNCEVLVNEN